MTEKRKDNENSFIFDQIQSGTGGKEGANVELALEKGGMGSYMMFSEYIKR